MADSVRDARRRRIAERGSDRLALITGRIKTLPSEYAPESGSDQSGCHSHTASCPPSISQIDLPSSDYPKSENKASGSLLNNHDSVREPDQQFTSGGRVGPYMRKCESSTEVSRASAFDFDVKGPSAQVTSTTEIPRVSTSDSDDRRTEPHFHNHKIVTLNQLSSAIGATEAIRTYFSLAMAILVVSSYVGFPIVGSRILKSFISFRPLYLLLLTNITIVLARLLEKQRHSQRPEQQVTSVPSVGEGSLPNQIGNALEVGLMLQNVTGALFMDCSIYAITVICGLSLVQSLGW